MARALALTFLAIAALAVAPAGASAAAFKAPHGNVLWGGQGGYSAGNIRDFARVSSGEMDSITAAA